MPQKVPLKDSALFQGHMGQVWSFEFFQNYTPPWGSQPKKCILRLPTGTMGWFMPNLVGIPPVGSKSEPNKQTDRQTGLFYVYRIVSFRILPGPRTRSSRRWKRSRSGRNAKSYSFPSNVHIFPLFLILHLVVEYPRRRGGGNPFFRGKNKKYNKIWVLLWKPCVFSLEFPLFDEAVSGLLDHILRE